MIPIKEYYGKYKNKHLLFVLCGVMFITSSCNSVNSKTSVNTIDTAEKPTVLEANEDIIITIALSQSDKNISKLIDDFNSSESGYKIKTKIYYSDTDENGMTSSFDPENMISADFDLIQDIINTDNIDIVYNGSIYDGSTYETLKNKEAFVDLYNFMEKDKEVNRDTIDEHVLKLNETNGALYSLPTYYVVHTLLGEKKYVGDKTDWTFDEFVSHWEHMPENSTVNGSPYAESVYRSVLSRNIESFLDYGTSSVKFDSQDFIKLLEFCNRFPNNGNKKYQSDYSSPRFVSPYELNGIMSAKIFNDKYENANHEISEYTLVGYPSSNGCGASCADSGLRFSICSNSSEEKQQAAWNFIRQVYTYDYQKEHAIRFLNESIGASSGFESEAGYCVNKKAFEEIAHDIISGKYTDYMIQDDDGYKLIIPTQKDYEQLCVYLKSVKKWETIVDRQLRDIVDEEVMAYFSGEYDLNTTIELIQNRATIWISEKG